MNNLTRSSLILLETIALVGCSFFPDKEKEYRYTHELPPLVVPNELNQRQVYAKPAERMREIPEPESEVIAPPLAASPAVEVADAPISNPPIPKAPVLAPTPKAEASPPTTVNPATAVVTPVPDANTVLQTTPLTEPPVDGSTYAKALPDAEKAVVPELKLRKVSERIAVLQLNQNIDQSWRIVGKALTEQAIEISARNSAAHSYEVQYEPNGKALKDDSLWDDFLFVFGAENNQEQPYKITLTAKDQQTEIRVLDMENKVCSTDACIQLTKTLRTAIEKAMKN